MALLPNWKNILYSMKGETDFVFPVHYFFPFREAFRVSITNEVVRTSFVGDYIYTYHHIIMADVSRGILLGIHWTGEKRFDPNKLEAKLYKAKFGRDIGLKGGCARIHTYGNVTSVNIKHRDISQLLNRYISCRTSMWRFLRTPNRMEGHLHKNYTLIPAMCGESCTHYSFGYITGSIIKCHELKNDNYVPSYLNQFPVMKAEIKVPAIKMNKGSVGGIKILKHSIMKAYLTSPEICEKTGDATQKYLYLLLQPWDKRSIPMILDIIPHNTNEMVKFLSGQIVHLALLFSLAEQKDVNNDGHVELKSIADKYERLKDIMGRIFRSADLLEINVAIENCSPWIIRKDDKLTAVNPKFYISKEILAKGTGNFFAELHENLIKKRRRRVELGLTNAERMFINSLKMGAIILL